MEHPAAQLGSFIACLSALQLIELRRAGATSISEAGVVLYLSVDCGDGVIVGRGKSYWGSCAGEDPIAKTVMILHDDLACLAAVCIALGEAGHAAIPAHTGREARALLDSFGPTVDVLIVDPAIRGARAFARRLYGRNPDLRIVQLAADPGRERAPLGPAGAVALLDPAAMFRMTEGDWAMLLSEPGGQSYTGAGVG